jgi:hypothetical protein
MILLSINISYRSNDLLSQDVDQTITDKEFYKAMQKLKERGTNAVPPKKSASAYIIFGKEVNLNLIFCSS